VEKMAETDFQNINSSEKKESGVEDWYILYTAPRREKKVKEIFERLHLPCYLPLLKVRKQWSDRKKWVEEPLFKSYIFVQKNPTILQELRNIPGALFLIMFEGRPASLSHQDIENIRLSLQFPEYISVEDQKYVNGQKIKISAGPFMGIEGYISQQKGKMRYQILIEQMGKSIFLNIPVQLLELP